MKVCPTCNRLYRSGTVVCPKDGWVLNTLREWQAGDTVSGKFCIIEKIGHGSLGPAFRAKILPFGGTRVLKCLSVRLADEEHLIDHFRREIKAASSLRHLNAAHVESLEHSPDGRPFIVMEYVAGLSLRELISRGGYIQALDVMDIMGQICAALDCAHGQGILHRNLKPDNVIVAEELDGSPRVKVMEFGMANLRQAAAESGRQVGDVVMTDQGAVVGTMEYMSPEQAAGTPTSKLDVRSDIYSVGVMMFEALTGELPIAADDPTGLLYQHQGIAANELLCGMVLKALQREPDCRFQTATEMIAALREVSHSLGKPSLVTVMSDTEAVAQRVSSPAQASPQTLEAGESHPARAPVRQNAKHTVPRISGRGHASPAMPASSVRSAATDRSIDEIRKAWQQSVAQVPAQRPARSKRVRTSLLFICCTLGVFLASSVMYRNRGLFMTLHQEGTTGEITVASPEGPAHDPASNQGSQKILNSPVETPQVSSNPAAPQQAESPPLTLPLAEGYASPVPKFAGRQAPQQKSEYAAETRSGDKRLAASTLQAKSPEAMRPTSSSEAEINKSIAIGWLLVGRRDYPGSIESFTAALKIDPNNAEAKAALRLVRFASQNPNVDVLPSQSPADENRDKKGGP